MRKLAVTYRIPIIVFFLLNLADAALTHVALSRGAQELNPLMSHCTTHGGLFAVKILVCGLSVFLLLRFNRMSLIKYVNVGMVFVVCLNTFTLWSLT